MGVQAFEPSELVIEFGTRLGVSIGIEATMMAASK
jgi:hypothetical protein